MAWCPYPHSTGTCTLHRNTHAHMHTTGFVIRTLSLPGATGACMQYVHIARACSAAWLLKRHLTRTPESRTPEGVCIGGAILVAPQRWRFSSCSCSTPPSASNKCQTRVQGGFISRHVELQTATHLGPIAPVRWAQPNKHTKATQRAAAPGAPMYQVLPSTLTSCASWPCSGTCPPQHTARLRGVSSTCTCGSTQQHTGRGAVSVQ